MTQQQPVIRIGELLVQSGVITAYDLSEAEKLSSHMKVQFGRLLIMAGCLTEEALECALEAQQLIKEGMLNSQIACEALAFAVQENIPLRQSLEMLDCLPQFGTSTLRLAELIHDANIIDEEKLHDAFDTSMETNRPLPEVLVEMECISPGLLSIMLRMQEQIRAETLDREDAINELKGTFKIWKRADKAMANDPMSKSAIISSAIAAPDKPSRYTSSFDSVTRLPAMSPEILANLNAQEAASAGGSSGTAAGAQSSSEIAAYSAPNSVPSAPSQSAAPGNSSAYAAPGAPASSPSAQSQSQTSGYADPRTRGQSAPGRGGNDDLNVDRILQDYANTPAGQPMPDGLILYSQGYFPPDPQNKTDEVFADEYSDEDEQRINDLLDVFASDGPVVNSAASGQAVPAQSGQQAAYADTNFAQSSYSASLAAAAADGWGVPDLAAAGANLSGAEMFARAQAELANSGWAYSQASTTQAAAAPSAPSAPPVPPGPLGQPSYVTPTPPAAPPKGLGHPDFQPAEPSNFVPAPPSTSVSAPTSTPISTPIPEATAEVAPPSPAPVAPTSSSVDTPVITVTDADDSLFSPQLKHSISDALSGNPFKIRKSVGGESGANIEAVPSTAGSGSTEVSAKDSQSELAEANKVDETFAKVDSKDSESVSTDSEPSASESDKSVESKNVDSAAPEPSQVRGKFGTKTGLAAKRKAADVAEDSEDRNDVVYLLKTANFFTADELEDALVNCLRDQTKAIEILAILGIIDKSNLDAAVRLQKLVKSGSVEKDKAIESLKNLQSGKIRPSELTEQLGIKKTKRRK